MDYGNVLHIQSTSIILDDVFNQHFFANVQCLRYVCVCVWARVHVQVEVDMYLCSSAIVCLGFVCYLVGLFIRHTVYTLLMLAIGRASCRERV